MTGEVAVVAHHPGEPLLSGLVPPLADFFLRRAESGPDLVGLRPGQTMALTPDGQGGTGKTQLAVEFVQALRRAGAVEVLVWVTAASREAVIAGFAHAASMTGTADPEEDAEAAADRFVTWLAHTSRPWALIVDDLADTADLKNLWPSGPSGRVVITTRLPAAALDTAEGDVITLPVGGFSRREALSYLNSRLTEYADQRIQALDLCEDLGGMPLCLAQAAAVIEVRGMSCREYRTQLNERRKHMSGVSVAGVSPEVLATWSLAVECAQELSPAGLAWPALTLAAVLDPHGVPGAVLTSQAACGYIIGRPPGVEGTDKNVAQAALNNLARAGLVSITPESLAGVMRMHPSVQLATRAYLPREDLRPVTRIAADALADAWPKFEDAPLLEQVMRDCASALHAADDGSLWQPDVHPLLLRAGLSLERSRFTGAAVAYWQSMLTTCTRLGGPTHPSAVVARDRLGAAYESAGRTDAAIAIFQKALSDSERSLGLEHPETLTACDHLAHAYQTAGRLSDAVGLYERTVAGFGRHLGPAHPDTLAARSSLADAYQAAGMLKDSLSTRKLLLTDSERLFGAIHPATLTARASLADAYEAAGQPKDAVEQYKRVLAGQQESRGRDHPDTISARADLASALRRAGNLKDAIKQYERVLADRRRIEGDDHPDTLAALANLAFAYRSAGQLREAIPVYERTLADRERWQGSDHRDTRIARSNLAAAYQQAGRVTDAIHQQERALADSERMLGPGNLETLTARCKLAAGLYAAGRLTEVVAVLERALADCERYLGPGHPMTQTVRDNLDAATTT